MRDIEEIQNSLDHYIEYAGEHNCSVDVEFYKELRGVASLCERYDEVLRALAFDLGAGGYNSEGLIGPNQAKKKIQWGIDNLVKNKPEGI